MNISNDIINKLKKLDLSIIIFPFGKMARYTIDVFLKLGYKIDCIWDNYSEELFYSEIPIKKPSSNIKDNNILIICTTSDEIIDEFENQVEFISKHQIYYGGQILSSNDLDYNDYRKNYFLIEKNKIRNIKNDNPNLLIIPNIEISVTDKCSLKCKYCANLMQYFTSPKDANIEKMIKTIDSVLDSIDFLGELRILGGEPFMYKEIYRYIDYFKMKDKISTIHIYTNGTIVPSEKNIESFKNNKTFISISNYGELSKNLKNLEYTLSSNKILYDIDNIIGWNDCSSIKKHNRTFEQQKNIFSSCCCNRNLTLRNGYLYTCPFIANALALEAIPEELAEGIEIFDVSPEIIRNNILKYYEKPFIKACDYCTGRLNSPPYIPVAEQIPSSLQYKKIDFK